MMISDTADDDGGGDDDDEDDEDDDDSNHLLSQCITSVDSTIPEISIFLWKW